MEENMPGGFGGAHEATEDIQMILDSVKNSIQERTAETYSTFVAKKYKAQVVAGMIYFIHVEIDGGRFLHVKIVKPLPHTGLPPSLLALRQDVQSDTPLDPSSI